MIMNRPVAGIATVLALLGCAPVQAQVDIRKALDPWRGNQGPSSRNSSPSRTQTTQDKRQDEAYRVDAEGVAAEDKGDWAAAEVLFKKALEITPNDPIILQNLAGAQNREGIEAHKAGDYTTALSYFKQALANDPGNEHIRGNLAAIEEILAAARREQERRQQDRVNAARMQQDVQNLAQSLTAPASVPPSSGGLDFMPAGATSSRVATAPALDFGDPMVVDARRVRTGLPKSVAAEIPDTPAGDRVRKGFQAITAHDWNVAQAWFRDALNHDPGNPGIQRLIELADYTMERERHPSLSTPPRTTPPDTSARDKAALAALDTNLENGMDAALAKAFDDFSRNYLPKHPGLMNPMPSKGGSLSAPTPEAEAESARWRTFFNTLFIAPLGTTKAGAVRN